MVTSPNNPVDILNMALGYIGEAPIRSIESPTKDIERQCGLYYHATRRYCLTLSLWNFAKRQAPIPRTGDGQGDFTSTYQLPNDMITFISVGGDTEYDYIDTYDVRGDQLHYDSDANSVVIRYVFDNEDITKWAPGFVMVVARALALELAYFLSKKDNIIKTNNSMMQIVLADAIAKDGSERPPIRIETSKILEARRRLIGGTSDDPTRIVFD